MTNKPITHQDLINSELETLKVLRKRLNAAITILDADVTDIKAVHGFDKIEAYKAECKEALRLINEKGMDLQDLLQGLLEVPNQ